MKHIKKFVATFLLIACGLLPAMVEAQKPAKPAVPASKAKLPVVKTFLGKFSGITNACIAEQAKQMIALPLRIVDNKEVEYKLNSYQFSYKRIGVTEDEQTGKTSPQTDMVTERFAVTPMTELWQNNIKETLHQGEELYFFDVIVSDKQGRLFFAPDLKITIQ